MSISQNQNKLKLAGSVSMITFANGKSFPEASLPKMEPLSTNATIEMKAEHYDQGSMWQETGTIQGFPTYECYSPVSQNIYAIVYRPMRGCYGCNCDAGRKAWRLPLEDCEPRCWHLYQFNAAFLPGIMAARRAAQAAPTPAYSQSPLAGRKSGSIGVPYPAPVSAATYATAGGR